MTITTMRLRSLLIVATVGCWLLPVPRVTAEGTRPEQLLQSLIDRYRGLVEYEDTVRLEHRTVDSGREVDPAAPEPAASLCIMDCMMSGSTLAVRASSVGSAAASLALGAPCDVRDASPASRLRLANQLWFLPHLWLRFGDEPLRSMQGAGGTLVPLTVETVTVGTREFLRLHLESRASATGSSPAPATDPSRESAPSQRSTRAATVDLFVNPRSMLVERVEHSREIADGVRYEATIDITPERAVASPAKESDSPDQVPDLAPERAPDRAPDRAPNTTPPAEPATAPATGPSLEPAPATGC